ncbi:MAG: exonuclease V subunit gamma, partial [Cyanobacteria bacterium K_DeepCast_35m_m2_023]|nr:exonuclease V subunit gamma [Cyanobacteria bacterium K_DeepCast_35m_m2_023]
QLRRWVAALLDEDPGSADPWRASDLVWPVLELLDTLIDEPEAAPLRHWLQRRGTGAGQLDLALWQLGRAIADAFDDYALYRPDLLASWWHNGAPGWQPRLLQLLRQRLPLEPFGLRVARAIERLQQGPPAAGALPSRLRLFGLSAMAPIQVQLLQAISAHRPVDLYLLTPCRDLWQRCGSRRRQLSEALSQPLAAEWLLEAPGLEARFGRLGAEFQQLLEGSGETLLGQSEDVDLFFAPATAWSAQHLGPPPLLAQLQQQLADPDRPLALARAAGDASLEFHPCPGRLRQVQIVRDRVLQLLAADPSLEPRDVLVMTPQVDALAPLVAAVFGDQQATGVRLPWRLTDRSQQSDADLSATLLQLLQLASERLSATALEALLERPCLGTAFGLDRTAIASLNRLLQQAGFRWGLDAAERGGAASGSLAWACDRLLLGLVLPPDPGLAPADTAPLAVSLDLETLGRGLHLLGRLRHWLGLLRQRRTSAAWGVLLRSLLADLFGEQGAAVPEQAWELPQLLAAVDAWLQAAADRDLELDAAVAAAVLQERLAVDSGRFGHRSGALTVSALEPMRAIPHRVVVLMGLDAGSFPRRSERPGFHLLEQQRRLGDPNPADQDRYVLLEALLSARDHLLITWSSRDERSGETLPPATPVRQWLSWLQAQLPCGGAALLAEHSANPLQASNFVPTSERPPASCDQRALRARALLDGEAAVAPLQPLALSPAPAPGPTVAPGTAEPAADLAEWLLAPQRCWLGRLGLDPREWNQLIGDLDASELAERERSALLREALAAADAETAPDYGQPGAWQTLGRGRGLLPAGSAAALEADTLASRWCELQAVLEPLGPQRTAPLSWQQWQQPLLWRGQTLVLLQPARDRSRHHVLLGWQLLLAAAAGLEPAAAVLVARGDKGFGIQGRFAVPTAAAAQGELQRLAQLRQQWQERCWPVPPRSGWALLTGGEAKAIAEWEGNLLLPGERHDPEQALCFGSELSGLALWRGPAGEQRQQLAAELLDPLLALRR